MKMVKINNKNDNSEIKKYKIIKSNLKSWETFK